MLCCLDFLNPDTESFFNAELCFSCRMVMEEGGQRDRGRGAPTMAGAEGRQIFVELGE